MTKTLRRLGPVAAVLALTLAVAACGGDDDGGSTELTGDVLVDGSSTVAPLSTAASALFAEVQPKVKVPVGTSGTGGGFEKFCKGETDISDASRQIKDSEKEKQACDKAGIAYTEFQVANDALTVVVNKGNTFVDCLTTEQLKKIFDQGSTVTTWNQVDPKFPAEKMEVFGPGTDSGTFDFFTEEINGKTDQHRSNYTASENDNVLVQGVAGSTGGIGYFGFTYFEENMDKLKALKIDAGKGCVEPSVATAQDGTYEPLSRPLFIYVANRSYAAKPQVKAFVDFYVESIEDIVQEAKYVPLTAPQKATLAAALENAKKG